MMDAKEFLMICVKECRGNTCGECKFFNKGHCCASRLGPSGKSESDEELEQRVDRAISIAEKLSHVKTFCDDFFEKFPYASKLINGRPILCRNSIYSYAKAEYCRGKDCKDCWNEPYYEPEEETK